MENRTDNKSDKMIDLALMQIDTLTKTLANFESTFKAIQKEFAVIEKRAYEAEKQIQIYLSEQDSQKAIHIQGQPYFILPNIEKKNEEAIYDAISFCKKKCPYCDTNLYDGHLRKKIEIDHFIPISKGGQDVPWNILPSCKKCNSAKRNRLPEAFLETERRQYCENYLDTIRKRLVAEIQIQIE